MTFKELLDNELNEERNGGDFSDYHVEVGEDEGNVPHLHLIHKDDFRKNTAIRIDMPYYFLHGSKTYILNNFKWEKRISKKQLGKSKKRLEYYVPWQ